MSYIILAILMLSVPLALGFAMQITKNREDERKQYIIKERSRNQLIALQDKTDLELDELVAALQIGIINQSEYHPTSDTTEGKLQAWDLLVKRGLVLYTDAKQGKHTIVGNNKPIPEVKDIEPQRAIVIATILSLREDRIYYND